MYTPSRWTKGWGQGLTGPNTVRCGGVTCQESLEDGEYTKQFDNWRKEGGKDSKPTPPIARHIPISVGTDTLALVVGENREANARLMASAPRLLEALRSILTIGKRDLTNPKYDGYFQEANDAVDEALKV